ncbi:hypothetical protein Pen01_41520 [Phytomonospora endophytica]|nr:hypothetical protein Pen01_41520 [Phytomonospora endophytica]
MRVWPDQDWPQGNGTSKFGAAAVLAASASFTGEIGLSGLKANAVTARAEPMMASRRPRRRGRGVVAFFFSDITDFLEGEGDRAGSTVDGTRPGVHQLQCSKGLLYEAPPVAPPHFTQLGAALRTGPA